jgi:hypothetical protein
MSYRPRGASVRELDLVVLLLAAGSLAARQRTLARRLIVGLDVDALPPATAHLRRKLRSPDLAALADRLRRDTAPPAKLGDDAFSEHFPSRGQGAGL